MTPRPNLVYVMTDDHAAHALGTYGSVVNTTPELDRIASGGMRFDNCFCTNSICTPSRASILTGTYSHVNEVTTLHTPLDHRHPTFPAILQQAGYQTAVFGKWHLGHGAAHDPDGFDDWAVLPDQGEYHDPELLSPDGRRRHPGYVTDLITDLSLDWLADRDPDRPFCLLVHHKAPHRPWEPDARHATLYADHDIPEPATLRDDHEGRAAAAAAAMRVRDDLDEVDLKAEVPEGLPERGLAWKYQRYMKDYLRCVASVDDNVGRILDHLDDAGVADDTMVVYTSDQGFFLGDHGWYDKRFMYEESLRMPLLVRYPPLVDPGSDTDAMVLNVDFAPTFLELAGCDVPSVMQGDSFLDVLAGTTPAGWRRSMYYRYWMHDDPTHHVRAHHGVRTHRFKLVCFPGHGQGDPGTSPRRFRPQWELFDLERDPHELDNVVDDPAYADVRDELTRELERLQAELGDRVEPATTDGEETP